MRTEAMTGKSTDVEVCLPKEMVGRYAPLLSTLGEDRLPVTFGMHLAKDHRVLPQGSDEQARLSPARDKRLYRDI